MSGSLETMPLADLLQLLAQSFRTGTLEVRSQTVTKSIYFDRGKIVSASSSDPSEVLGHFLVGQGMIDEEQLALAVAEQEKNGGLLGQILVELDVVTAEVLEHVLRVKAEECLFELFAWRSGSFHFHDDQLPGHEIVPISLHVTDLLLEGMQRIDEWALIREVVRSAQAIPVVVVPPPLGEMDDAASAVFAAIDDQRTVHDIFLQTHSSEYAVSHLLSLWSREGRVKVVNPAPAASPVATPPPATDGQSLLEKARDRLDQGDVERAWWSVRAASCLDPHNRALQAAVHDIEQRIAIALDTDGVRPTAVPSLNRSLDALRGEPLTPEEGFVLSRVNGVLDVDTIVKMSPLPGLDALVVFWRLREAGHISLDRPTLGRERPRASAVGDAHSTER